MVEYLTKLIGKTQKQLFTGGIRNNYTESLRKFKKIVLKF